MSLRFKVLTPLVLFSLFLASYVHFSWLPNYTAFWEERNRVQLAAHLDSVVEGVVPLLLDNHLSRIYENLDVLLDKNPNWVALSLRGADGQLLYPLDLTGNHAHSDPATLVHREQPITYLGRPLGSLSLTMDTGNDLRATQAFARRFWITSLIAWVAFMLAVGLTLEFVVRRRLGQLSEASNRLAQGDFDAHLPAPSQDEVGALVTSFTAMRDAIRRFQGDLRAEVGSHKRTAEALLKEKERVSYHARHDALTGLVNRREFEHRLNRALDDSHESDVEHALLYMDLDQFRVVNDTCGHVAGDELLKQLGGILQQKLRKADTLARLGGDEFGVLLEGCDVNEGTRVAATLREAIQDFRFMWDDHIFNLGVSVGVVAINKASDTVAQLLSAADTACYAAKDGGRNRIHVYQPDDSEVAERHGEMQWVSRITRALEDDRFVLYCQPIVPVADVGSTVEHYEILVRMLAEDGSTIPPGAFIPAAERYNLMDSIDRWVVANAFMHLDRLSRAGWVELPSLAINLSGASLSHESLLPYVREQLGKYAVKPGLVCFEITETAAIANLSAASHVIKELKRLGCKFSLDDFGSGLSSFAYLKNLPVDYLKIDGIFVRDIAEDAIDRAMVKSINEVGHTMEMQTIAEFVENDAILARLKEIGVDLAQGYGISPPAPLEDILAVNPVPLAGTGG